MQNKRTKRIAIIGIILLLLVSNGIMYFLLGEKEREVTAAQDSLYWLMLQPIIMNTEGDISDYLETGEEMLLLRMEAQLAMIRDSAVSLMRNQELLTGEVDLDLDTPSQTTSISILLRQDRADEIDDYILEVKEQIDRFIEKNKETPFEDFETNFKHIVTLSNEITKVSEKYCEPSGE
ncbi:hypothetical protein ACERII_09885 [Evansella sp. AB-rgal1]|uniref:hypothetical protein n=1 Tax=Evansella sp. AB-rgal1 TaxID=3242696 RepID=UPI00359E027A